MIELNRIRSQARGLVTPETYKAVSDLSLGEFIQEFPSIDGRKINLEPLIDVVQTAVQKYQNENPYKSDAWLAPRVHAALRLFRTEAADDGLWEYLTICVPSIREYVIWRWQDENTGLVKDLSRVYKVSRRNALGRLWWSAELTRNGEDYSSTVDLFLSQDAVNWVTDTLAYQNRPAALAYTRMVKKIIENGGQAKSAAKRIGKGFTHLLVTVVLDAAAQDDTSDMFAYENWVREDPDATLLVGNLPEGPHEPKVSDEKINAVLKLMELIK